MRRLPILLPLLAVLSLNLACTDSGSLPTQPVDPGAASAWSMIYPSLTNADLRDAWGLDADDMWAVGEYGTIVHYDGARCSVVESSTDEDLVAVHGRARDDVWCVGGRQVLHWNGIRWRVVFEGPDPIIMLSTIWCAGPDDVFVGGQTRIDGELESTVLRLVGDRASTTIMPADIGQYPHLLWQPDPDGPLLLASYSRLYRYRNSRWIPLDSQTYFYSVDGAIAVGRNPDDDDSSLFGFDDTGEPYSLCPDAPLGSGWSGAEAIVDARVPVAGFSRSLVAMLDDCQPTAVDFDSGVNLNALAIPELLRPSSPVIFAAGDNGAFLRGVWNDDLNVTWQPLIPGTTPRLGGAVTGTAELVFLSTRSNELLIRENGSWRTEHQPAMSYDSNLAMLPDGSLVTWRRQPEEIAVRRPDATWESLPEAPAVIRHLWTDGRDAALMYDDWIHEWTLADGQWSQTDSLDTWVVRLEGREENRVYRLTDDRRLRRLVDGQWEHVLGDESIRVEEFHVSPWSNDVYVFLRELEGRYTAILRDGLLIRLTHTTNRVWPLFGNQFCEVRPGDLYWWYGNTLMQIVDRNWVEIDLDIDGQYLENVWGHPDQGLFVLDNGGRLHHRPFPESTD